MPIHLGIVSGSDRVDESLKKFGISPFAQKGWMMPDLVEPDRAGCVVTGQAALPL